MSPEPSSTDTLVVRFEKRAWQLPPGPVRVAGRGAYIDLGNEATMHRNVAAFDFVGGRWFVLNLLAPPKRITVSGRDAGGPAPRLVPSREDAELPSGRMRLSFRIGADLRAIDLDVPARRIVADAEDRGESRTSTTDAGLRVELTPSRRVLAVALAELRLMDPLSTSPLPSKAEVRDRLRWSDKQYDNHLDQLCTQLAAVGVDGVVGGKGSKALRRREVVVDVLIENNVIGFHDLELLPSD